jgi:membrane protein DedA with SNARE-associated domain
MSKELEEIVITLGYLGIFIGLYIEHVFPPAPAQVVIPVAGFMVGRGELDFWGVLIAGSFGAVLGSYTLYSLGNWLGEDRTRNFIRKYGRILTVTEHDLERSFHFVDRYGRMTVFISHMIPLSVVRVVVSIFAGVNRMRREVFTLSTTVGTLIWIGGQLYLAVVIGEEWDRITAEAARYEGVLWGVGGTLTVLFVVWYVRRLRNHSPA